MVQLGEAFASSNSKDTRFEDAAKALAALASPADVTKETTQALRQVSIQIAALGSQVERLAAIQAQHAQMQIRQAQDLNVLIQTFAGLIQRQQQAAGQLGEEVSSALGMVASQGDNPALDRIADALTLLSQHHPESSSAGASSAHLTVHRGIGDRIESIDVVRS